MERKRRNKQEEKEVSSIELTKRVLVYLYNKKRNQKVNQELENQKGILPLVQTVIEFFKTVDPKTWLKLTVGMGFCIFSLITYWNLKQKLKQMSNPLRSTHRPRFVEDLNSPLMSLEQWNELRRSESDEDNIFDVCIVGAGPSGGTCAFYLAKGGKRVLLLDKSHFPRDKVCGNTINTTAQYHLKEMGVLQEILSEIGLSKWAYNGGLVSPSGDSFVGDFTSSRMIHIKRSILDYKIAVAAARQGATFRDNTNVEYVKFNEIKGIWDIHVSKNVYKAKVLVAADGAESRIARQLGYVGTPPDSVGGTAYSEENTHGLQAGHVIFYTKDLLPGHIVMANEANKTLNLSCFVYSETDPKKVNELFQDVAQKDELISRSLGHDALLSPFQTAPLRIKTVEKPYGDHFLIVGEAAGHVDALTGEGIQYGMDAGKIAAQVLLEALYIDDLTENRLKSYHEQWKQKYDWDFYFSTKLTEIIKKHPIVMDATVAVIRRRGADFVTSWSLVSTGVKSKVWFARPDVGWMIALEAFSIWLQKICKSYIY